MQETTVSFRCGDLILRDFQESAIDSMLCWHTGHHPWMDWDAPWEEQPETIDAEKYRAWALANIAAKNPPYKIADEQGSSLQSE